MLREKLGIAHLLEILRKRLTVPQRHRLLAEVCNFGFGNLLLEVEADIVIFGFSAHAQPTRLETRKQDADKFSKAGGIENRDSLIGAARRVICIDSAARDRTFALGTDRVDPAPVST